MESGVYHDEQKALSHPGPEKQTIDPATNRKADDNTACTPPAGRQPLATNQTLWLGQSLS